MKMTASTRLVGSVTVVDLSGRIVLGDGNAGLRDLVHNLGSEGNKMIPIESSQCRLRRQLRSG